MDFLKKINWSNVATIAVVAVVAAIFVVPLVRPLFTKLPVVGKFAA
jgi:hypothetical protein